MLEGLTPPAGKFCVIGKAREQLSDQDKKIFDDACADPRWETRALLNELNARGMDIRQTALLHHRKKECRCNA